MNAKNFKYIAIEEIAHDLGILEVDVEIWLRSRPHPQALDYRNRRSVPSEIKYELANSPEFPALLKHSINSDRHQWDISTLDADSLRTKRKQLLELYSPYLSELKTLHSSLRSPVNCHSSESAVRAAYLLHSKAISCLLMGHENISNGYWVAGSIIREIDETLDLAQYFIIKSAIEDKDETLRKWYRENYAPKHSECRKLLSQHLSTKIGGDTEEHRQLLYDLYQAKSKWVHPTFGVIREVTSFDAIGDSIDISQCTLGPTNHELKLLILADFFRSSIWSTFQSMTLCFSNSLPLNDEAQIRLQEIDSVFADWQPLAK